MNFTSLGDRRLNTPGSFKILFTRACVEILYKNGTFLVFCYSIFPWIWCIIICYLSVLSFVPFLSGFAQSSADSQSRCRRGES